MVPQPLVEQRRFNYTFLPQFSPNLFIFPVLILTYDMIDTHQGEWRLAYAFSETYEATTSFAHMGQHTSPYISLQIQIHQ